MRDSKASCISELHTLIVFGHTTDHGSVCSVTVSTVLCKIRLDMVRCVPVC